MEDSLVRRAHRMEWPACNSAMWANKKVCSETSQMDCIRSFQTLKVFTQAICMNFAAFYRLK